MTDPIFQDRALAKRRCERLGIADHPWHYADDDLAREIAADEQRQAEEAERREAEETKHFGEELRNYKVTFELAKAAYADVEFREKAISEDGNGAALYQRLRGWLSSPSAHIYKQERQLVGALPVGKPASKGEPPPGFTWEQIDRAEAHRRALVELQNARGNFNNHEHTLRTCEDKYPVLRDFRGA
jgi:hypothetical protein